MGVRGASTQFTETQETHPTRGRTPVLYGYPAWIWNVGMNLPAWAATRRWALLPAGLCAQLWLNNLLEPACLTERESRWAERGSFPEGREGREGPAAEGPAADCPDCPAWEKTPGLPQQGAGNVFPACSSAEPSEGRLGRLRCEMQRRLNCNLWGRDNAGRLCKAEGAGVAEVRAGGSQSPAGPQYPASQDCGLATGF